MSTIIVYIMLFFMVIGGIDKIIGNRIGLGEEFDEGFKTMGPLSIAMLGIYSLAPVLAKGLMIVTKPIYSLVGIGIIKNFQRTMKAFDYLGKTIVAISILGLICSALQMTTGKVIILGMIPLEEGFKVVGSIAIILLGAFPLLHVITIVFQKPLCKLGNKIDIEEKTIEGIIAKLVGGVSALVLSYFLTQEDLDMNKVIINIKRRKIINKSA